MSFSADRPKTFQEGTRRPVYELSQDEFERLEAELKALRREWKELEAAIDERGFMEGQKDTMILEIQELSRAQYGWRDEVSPDVANEIERLLAKQRQIQQTMEDLYRAQMYEDSRMYQEHSFASQRAELDEIDARISALLPPNSPSRNFLMSSRQAELDRRLSYLRTEVAQVKEYFSTIDQKETRYHQVLARISDLARYVSSHHVTASAEDIRAEKHLMSEYAIAAKEANDDTMRWDDGGRGESMKRDVDVRLRALRRRMAQGSS